MLGREALLLEIQTLTATVQQEVNALKSETATTKQIEIMDRISALTTEIARLSELLHERAGDPERNA
jgi:hypothetical protein